MDPEILIEKIGGFGRYQKLQYFLFSTLWIGSGVQAYLAVFAMYVPPYRCAIPGLLNDSYSDPPAWINESIPLERDPHGKLEYSHCKVFQSENASSFFSSHVRSNGTDDKKVPCERWVYDKSQIRDTASTQMNFVCSQASFISILNMGYMFGVFWGSTVFGIMADKKGRKLALYVSIVMYLLSVLPLYFVHDPVLLGILRMFTGAGVQGMFMSAFILAMEMVQCSQRSATGVHAENFFAGGELLVVLLGYLTQEWRLLSLCSGVIFIPCLFYWFFLEESPRWLLSVGRIEEAKEVFHRMAVKNKVPLSKMEIKENNEEKEEKKEIQNGGLKDLFKSKILLIRSLIIFFNWAVINMVYYGLMFNSGSLSSNLYLGVLLSGLVEIPAYTLLIFTMDKWGRKPIFCSATILSGVGCITSGLVNVWFRDVGWLSMTLALVGKFAISSSFGVMYNMTTELFPTVVRNAALGVSSCAGRAGSMAAPYIILAGTLMPSKIGQAMPLILFGGFALVGGLLSLLLPETAGRSLPETIEDGENFGRELKSGKTSTEVYDNEGLETGGKY